MNRKEQVGKEKADEGKLKDIHLDSQRPERGQCKAERSDRSGTGHSQ